MEARLKGGNNKHRPFSLLTNDNDNPHTKHQDPHNKQQDPQSEPDLSRFQQTDLDPSTHIKRQSEPTLSLEHLQVEISSVLKKRPRWGSRRDYLLSCLGFAVGLPTVWRFPNVTYENGGGSFLLAFLILSFLIGLPLYQLELSLGQFLQSGFVRIWPHFSARLAGFGFSSLILAGLCATYFGVILSWTLLFLATSFQWPPPWKAENEVDPSGPATRFFFERILRKSPSLSIANVHDVNWQLIIALFVAWLVVFASIRGGVTRTGWMATFAGAVPLLGLLLLLAHGLTLPGAWSGLKFLLMPNLKDLLNPILWGKALEQVFFSTGVGWGSLVNFASYSHPQNDFVHDAALVLSINVGTSIMAALGIFSVIGHVASLSGVGVPDVVTGESGLLFIFFPAALSSLSPILAYPLTIGFLILIVSLGLSSILTMTELIATTLCDANIISNSINTRAAASICLTLLLAGIPLVLPNGIYLLEILDASAATLTLLAIPFLEVFAVTYIQSIESFVSSVRHTTGIRLRLLFRFLMRYILPTLMIGVIGGTLSELNNLRKIQSARGDRAGPLGSGCIEACNHHGVCDVTFDFCRCEQSWGGSDCNRTLSANERGCPEDCNNRGRCDHASGACQCNAEYYGPSCHGEKYSQSLPFWAILSGWGVALASLVPGVTVAVSISAQERVMRMLCLSERSLSRPWALNESDDEEERMQDSLPRLSTLL